MNKLAERLKEKLIQNDLSQNKFCKIIGVRQNTVSRWCNGLQEPNLNTLLKICLALNTDPNFMLGFDEIR